MRILTPKANYQFEIREVIDSDPLVVKETWVENVYQINEGDLEYEGTFIDIGANIGAVSIWAASLNDGRDETKKHIKVFAFEPQPDNLQYLNRNIKLNKKVGEVRIFPVAVYNEAGKMMITDQGGSSSLLKDGENKAEVDVITFADVFTLTKVEQCDVMKVDIEGAEYKMIIDANDEDLLRVRYLTLEFDGGHDPEEFGALIYKISRLFNTHIIGSPERGGYIYARRY